MAGLTQKQEAFCLAVVTPDANGHIRNDSEAYRSVYNCSRMKPETVNNKAYILKNKGEIRARIEELRGEAAKEAVIDLATHLQDLKELREEARKAKQYSAAISAEISRGKAVGLYTEKIEANVRSRVVDFGADDQDL